LPPGAMADMPVKPIARTGKHMAQTGHDMIH
jgi:hypothetical protein